LALLEWAQDRCWLGASAARGTGWASLEGIEIVRIPLTIDGVEAWPTNGQRTQEGLWKYAVAIPGTEIIAGDDRIHALAMSVFSRELSARRFWYLTIDATLVAGMRGNGYGLDAFSVGGHNAELYAPLPEFLVTPHGQDQQVFRRKYQEEADARVITTRRQLVPQAANTQPADEPYLPGSGLRGPLRHATSRRARGGSSTDPGIPDPNQTGATEASADAVSQLFGLVGHSSRLLLRDAMLVPVHDDDDGAPFRLAWFQHHAEDEFTGGVYESSKYDRTAVIEGSFELRLVIEAASPAELLTHAQTLYPTLKLAELGHVPIGRGKWGGLGWIPWKFTSVHVAQAGDASTENSAPPASADIEARMREALAHVPRPDDKVNAQQGDSADVTAG